MKKSHILILAILMNLPFILKAQNILYSTDFNSSAGWSLGYANNFDTWVINGNYNCSTPTPNNGGGNYLHITDDLGGETCAFAGFYGLGSAGTCYATMNTGFSTMDQTEVKISFDWLCRGQTGAVLPSYGTLEYSTDGSNWVRITNPVNQFSGQTSWTTVTVSSNNVPGLLNNPNIKIRFGWVSSGYGSNPAFAVDNLKIEGVTSCTNTGGSIKPGELSLCVGENASLSLTGASGSIQWQDSTSEGSWANVNGNEVNYTSAALTESRFFRVVLSQNGCPDQYSDTATVNVIQAIQPIISVFPAGEPFYCDGDTLRLTSQTENGGSNPGIFWYVGSEKFETADLELTLTNQLNGDTIRAYLVSSENCITADTVSSEPIVLLVHPLPDVALDLPDALCQGETMLELTGGSPAGGNYTGSGVEDNMFNLNQAAGTYTISYTAADENGCVNAATDSFSLDICTYLETALLNDISIFPNPADERGFEILSKNNKINSVKIYGTDGRLLIEKQNIREFRLMITDLTAGIYFVEVNMAGYSKVHRVAIKD